MPLTWIGWIYMACRKEVDLRSVPPNNNICPLCLCDFFFGKKIKLIETVSLSLSPSSHGAAVLELQFTSIHLSSLALVVVLFFIRCVVWGQGEFLSLQLLLVLCEHCQPIAFSLDVVQCLLSLDILGWCDKRSKVYVEHHLHLTCQVCKEAWWLINQGCPFCHCFFRDPLVNPILLIPYFSWWNRLDTIE